MAVEVIKEDEEISKQFWGCIESCVKCNEGTRYWWNGGTFPLCQSCAKEVDFEWCYKFAVKEGYGPLPEIKPKTKKAKWYCGGCGETDPSKRCLGCRAV